MLYFCIANQSMKNNYIYIFLLAILSTSTLLATSGNAFGLIPKVIVDTLKTKEVVGKLVDTRAEKPKSTSLITFKPFTSYSPYLRTTNRESTKVLSNVKIYPNPISDQINLTFKLSKQVSVSIKIMDALGNEISTLLSQRLDEGDQVQNFTLNSNLSSGFYFIRIMAGTETIVKRIQIR